jgi:hypothetical protein
MPRLQSDPALLECPDFASPTYKATWALFVNGDVTEEQAIVFLRNIWTAGNEADKASWIIQVQADEASQADQLCLHTEAEGLRAQAEIDEAEDLRKDELKKKFKYN